MTTRTRMSEGRIPPKKSADNHASDRLLLRDTINTISRGFISSGATRLVRNKTTGASSLSTS